MTYEERLNEFEKIENLNKFNSRFRVYFKDGYLTNVFYRSNKKRILESSDEISISIQEQFSKYKNQLEEMRSKNKERLNNMQNATNARDNMVMEMALCNDKRKFEVGSDVKFKNGSSMSEFFFKNIKRIYEYNTEYYVMLQNQYNEILKERRIKTKIEFQLLKTVFVKEEGFDKFIISTNFFYKGTHMPSWFYLFKDEILKGTSPIDQKIFADYHNYRKYFNKQRRDFLNEPNQEKFDEESNIAFLDGVLMYTWWEQNEDFINKSSNYIDKEIIKQYVKYKKNRG